MLHYIIHKHEAQKPWVVFIHGAGGSAQTWKYQFSAFQPHFNTLAIDLRDHGESKKIAPAHAKYSFELISKDIREVLEKEKVRKAHFVTLSFGSVLLQDFAHRYPDCIERAIIAGGIFKGNWAIKSFVYLAKFMNQFLSYPRMYQLFSFLLMPRKRNQTARRIYQMQARKLTQNEYMKWVGLYGEFFRLLKRFYHQIIPFPTQVIMGEQDFIFRKSARNFVADHHTATLIELKKAGHICNIEKADQFNQHAVSFLLQETNALMA